MKHEGYNLTSLDEDIAIIKLKKSIELTPHVQLACMPDVSDRVDETKHLSVNRTGVTLGYTFFRNQKNNNNYLLSNFASNILNISKCSDIMSINTRRYEELFCAGFSIF